MDMEEMFFLNVFNLIPGLQNECNDCKCWWFLGLIYPLLPISNAVTVVCASVMSETKCAYLLDF